MTNEEVAELAEKFNGADCINESRKNIDNEPIDDITPRHELVAEMQRLREALEDIADSDGGYVEREPGILICVEYFARGALDRAKGG